MEGRHHSRRVMLEDVAVIHPAPGPTVRNPGTVTGASGRPLSLPRMRNGFPPMDSRTVQSFKRR